MSVTNSPILVPMAEPRFVKAVITASATSAAATAYSESSRPFFITLLFQRHDRPALPLASQPLCFGRTPYDKARATTLETKNHSKTRSSHCRHPATCQPAATDAHTNARPPGLHLQQKRPGFSGLRVCRRRLTTSKPQRCPPVTRGDKEDSLKSLSVRRKESA